MPMKNSLNQEMRIVAECEEEIYSYATALGNIASHVLPATNFMEKFKRLWQETVKYTDVLDHVKYRTGRYEFWRFPLPEHSCRGLEDYASSGETFATVFCRVIEQKVIPLLNQYAQQAGLDPSTVEGHQWIVSRFRKLGSQFFIEYYYRKALNR